MPKNSTWLDVASPRQEKLSINNDLSCNEIFYIDLHIQRSLFSNSVTNLTSRSK